MYVSPLLAELDEPMRDLGYWRDPETNQWELSATTLAPRPAERIMVGA